MSKRLVDIAVSAAGLCVLWPLLLVVAVLIKVDSPGPVFFRQVRVGRFGRNFLIFKFRTMTHGARGGAEITVGSDPRITRVGKVLRRYKLDELPQLIDVLRGTMSLVGPRPEVPRYVQHYPPEWRDKVLSVRPGITDRASLHFRNESEILARAENPEREYTEVILPEKLRLAVQYAESSSLATDMRLIGETLSAVLGQRFATSPVSRFMNSPSVWTSVDRGMAWLHVHRRLAGPVVDMALVGLCWLATYLFRLGFERFSPARPDYDNVVLIGVMAAYGFTIFAFGVPRALWRFFSFHDVKRLASACLVAGLVCAVAVQMAQLLAVPRAVLVLHPLVTVFALSTVRLLYCMIYEHVRSVVDTRGHELRRAVVLASGDAVRRLVAGVHHQDGWVIDRILDDDTERHGARVGGVPVTGPLSQLLEPEILTSVDYILIAISDRESEMYRKALHIARQTGLPILLVPGSEALEVPPGSAGSRNL